MKDLDVVCVHCEDIESLGDSLGASVFNWSLCGVVPVKMPENHDGDFDSVLPVSQGSLIHVDILPFRRILVAGVEQVATMVVALHHGRVRRRPKVNQVEDEGRR